MVGSSTAWRRCFGSYRACLFWSPLLCIDQFAQREGSSDCQTGAFHNLHPMAAILIQHPLWDQNLRSTGQRHLYLVRSEMRTLPHHCHSLAVMRMVRVDRDVAQNMGSVWVLCSVPLLRECVV